MANQFSFGFRHDDISEDESDGEGMKVENGQDGMTTEGLAPWLLSLDDMLKSLPSQISYNTILLSESDDAALVLRRRDLFDIRAQLMAEDENPGAKAISGLSSDDIVPNVYEGGSKTWECSIDLARFLSANPHYFDSGEEVTVIELGCGTAIPTTSVLHHRLSQPTQPQSRSPGLNICLADYNHQVLELATVPNILLNALPNAAPTTDGAGSDSKDQEISPSTLSEFQQLLSGHAVSISAVAGSWSADFASLIPYLSTRPSANLLVLASETIYSPSSIRQFSQTLLSILGFNESAPMTDTAGDNTTSGTSAQGGSGIQVEHRTALVAAKRVYFGVGGGVGEFTGIIREMGGTIKVVWESEAGKGVGRVILEVGVSAR